MAQQGVRYIWIMAIFLVLSFSASWAGVHTHLPRGVNAANDTVEVDAGDTFIAAKATIDSLVLIIRDTTITGVSVYRMEAFNLHNPNQLGKFVPAGGGKMKLVSAYDDYRMQERNTSIVRTEGKTHPDWGVKIITAGKDSLITVDGSNHARPFVFVGGASNAILDATPVMTSVSTQDGRDWVSGTGGADWTLIDWMADAAYQWDTANYSQYKGLLTNRNAGSGWLALATSPVIVNASVNDGDVIRSPWTIHRDQFGRQLAFWLVSTSGGQSITSYNSSGALSIFDGASAHTYSVATLSRYSFIAARNNDAADLWEKFSPLSITGDTWALGALLNTAPGLRFTGNLGDVDFIPGASSAGRNSPRYMIGTATMGLALLDAKAGDNTNGAKAYIDASISTSLIYGNVMAAFSPASTASIAGISTIFSTAETAVTKTATPSGPNSHSWAFNGTTSISRVPDHDSLTFVAGQPMSIMIWFKVTAGSTIQNIIAKRDDTSGSEQREWNLEISANEYIFFSLFDESTNGYIGRLWEVPLPTSTWLFCVATFDGTNTSSGIDIWINAERVDNVDSNSGSFVAMENLSTPLTVGAYKGSGGNLSNFFNSEISPSILVRGVIPESVIEAEYARGRAAINSPTNDVLTSAAVLRVKAHPDGKYWGVLNASRLEVRDVHGAWIDTFACTSCGTLADFAFAPVPTDSFGVYLGGSAGYRAYVPDIRVEALAQAEWPDHSVIFDEGSVSIDSAGYGDFWRYSDAIAANGVVGQPQEIRHLSNPDSSRYRAKFVSIADSFYSKGTTLIGNDATDVTTITSDSNFVTGGAVIGIAGGVRQRYVDSTVDSLRFTNGSVTFENGNVGIGTTGPVKALHVKGQIAITPGTAANPSIVDSLDTNSGFNTLGADSVELVTGGTSRIRVDASGNVGIGTTGPDGKLSVFTASAGTVSAHTSADELVLENSGETGMSLLGGNSSDLSIYFGDANSNVQGSIVYANNGNKLGFGTAGTGNKMVINSAGKILIATSAAPTNAEVAINGELVLGDGATDNNHDLRINAGASYSEIIAGEVQFAVSSLSDLKTAIKPLVDVTSLRSAFRDSTTVKTWQWKRETLYQQRIVDEIMADSLRIPDLVLKEMVKREKIQVDTDTAITARVDTLVSISSRDSVIALVVIDSLGEVVTSTKIATYYDTLRIIETHYDTTWTPILYTVTSPEKKTIADSIRTAVVGTATAKVVAYNAKIDAQAGRQHIGIMAEDAYRIARIIAPEAAEPNVVDGNIIQAALVQMAIAHECELDSLKTVISALQNRVDALQIDLNARLKILEAK